MTTRDATTFKHGHNGYTNYGCRCDICRAAMSAYSKAYNAANPQRNRAKAKAWADANPDRVRAGNARRYAETRDQQLVNKKIYYRANRDAAISRAGAWTAANPEKVRTIRAAWKKRNPEKSLAHVELRRARKASADTRVITVNDWRRLCARHDHRCFYCGEVAKLTQDHIIPIVRGGRHAIGNLVPACITCNSSKGSKLLVEWRASRRAVAA